VGLGQGMLGAATSDGRHPEFTDAGCETVLLGRLRRWATESSTDRPFGNPSAINAEVLQLGSRFSRLRGRL